jgi:hypothetical protein
VVADGEGRGELTPEQEQQRFSTGGRGFEEPLRRVLIGGPGDESGETGGTMGTASAAVGQGRVDEDLEILERLARFEQSVIDGSLQNLGSVRDQLAEHIDRLGL